MAKSARPISFLDLTAELRNEIYRLAGPTCCLSMQGLPPNIATEWMSYYADTSFTFHLHAVPERERIGAYVKWVRGLSPSAVPEIERLKFIFKYCTLTLGLRTTDEDSDDVQPFMSLKIVYEREAFIERFPRQIYELVPKLSSIAARVEGQTSPLSREILENGVLSHSGLLRLGRRIWDAAQWVESYVWELDQAKFDLAETDMVQILWTDHDVLPIDAYDMARSRMWERDRE